MHICHCFKDFSLAEGGIERLIRYLSQEHLKLGHKVTVLTSAIPGSARREMIGGIEELRTRSLFKIFKVPVMPNYYRCLSSINADIIHAHGTIPGVSDIAILYATRNNKPSILDYQFDGNAESAIGTLFASIYNYFINPIAVSKASRVTATSRSYAETSPVLKRYLDKVEIIPNGVDLQRFSPGVEAGDIREKYGLPQEGIIFHAARLVKYKGLEVLIRAMKHVKDATLVIAGTGQLESHLRQIVREQYLDNVEFLGLVAHEELPRLYKVSDVYVQPAITGGEAWPMSALEAMACGTTVVASDLPGVRELVTDECGIRVKPKDVLGLASAINRLLADPNLREKMGEAGRENAERYGWKHIAERVLEIYKELLH